MRNNIEQYGKFYEKSPEHSYGKPIKIVEAIPDIVKTGSVLDIGAGDGRHSLFLASKGFEVKALDTSQVALDKLKAFAQKGSFKIETIAADLSQWTFDGDYDAMIVTVTLQHLQTVDALRVLEQMKKHTKSQGVNAIALFTSTGDRYELDKQEDPGAFYPADGWLKEYYKDWEIISYDQIEPPLINKTRPDGTPMRNVVERMLARKP